MVCVQVVPLSAVLQIPEFVPAKTVVPLTSRVRTFAVVDAVIAAAAKGVVVHCPGNGVFCAARDPLKNKQKVSETNQTRGLGQDELYKITSPMEVKNVGNQELRDGCLLI